MTREMFLVSLWNISFWRLATMVISLALYRYSNRFKKRTTLRRCVLIFDQYLWVHVEYFSAVLHSKEWAWSPFIWSGLWLASRDSSSESSAAPLFNEIFIRCCCLWVAKLCKFWETRKESYFSLSGSVRSSQRIYGNWCNSRDQTLYAV